MEKATAQAFYADLKALVAVEGRASEQVLILPGLSRRRAPAAGRRAKMTYRVFPCMATLPRQRK
jgi:hypothetical protein